MQAAAFVLWVWSVALNSAVRIRYFAVVSSSNETKLAFELESKATGLLDLNRLVFWDTCP